MPVGTDDNGTKYWHFYGCRLYKEDHVVKNESAACNGTQESPESNKQTPERRGSSRKRKKRKVCRSKRGRAVKKKKFSDDESDSESNDERYELS